VQPLTIVNLYYNRPVTIGHKPFLSGRLHFDGTPALLALKSRYVQFKALKNHGLKIENTQF